MPRAPPPAPVLPMSQIIAHDAPLLSPVSSESSWGQQQAYSPTTPAFDMGYGQSLATNFNYSQYNFPPSSPMSVDMSGCDSPVLAHQMLSRSSRFASPDSGSSSAFSDLGEQQQQQLCLPTHQVFDFQPHDVRSLLSTPMSASPPDSPRLIHHHRSASATPTKRPSDANQADPKKPRASANRISVKDFVPPDVSGLSKREARLVKNRAAAFLSRQRKREEFECMEVRVAELEAENVRLQQSLAHTRPSTAPSPSERDRYLSEIDSLRAQLAAAQQSPPPRKSGIQLPSLSIPIKSESFDHPVVPPSSPSSRAAKHQHQHHSGVGAGLMALLCALPSLLSVNGGGGGNNAALPSTFSYPLSSSSELPGPFTSAGGYSLDFSGSGPGEYGYDWAMRDGSLMDLDQDQDDGRVTSGGGVKKLEFVGLEAAGAGLDVSFESSIGEDGKITVRIHPSSPPSSSSASAPFLPTSSYTSLAGALSPSPHSEPFLGSGPRYGMMDLDGPSFATKRRVRIALKTLPKESGEGGEWEVEVC